MEQPYVGPGTPGLAARLLSFDFFQTFGEQALRDLEGELLLLHLDEGEVLFHQGDPGDSLYVLLAGRLGVTIRDPEGHEHLIDELEAVASVGEMALLTGRARSATVAALYTSELVRLSRAAFDRLGAKNPLALKEFAHAMLPRAHRAELVGVLASLFGDLSKEALHELQVELEWQHLESGDTLFRQGESGDALYLVVNGRLRVVIEDEDGTRRNLGEVTRGASVGESDLLTEECRSSTVYAIRDSDVVRLRKSAFERLVERNPQVLLPVSRFVAKRLRHEALARETSGNAAVTFAILPTSDASPLADFATQFVDALAVYGPTLLLSSTLLETRFGRAGIAQTPVGELEAVALVGWLSEQETQYRYIVYEADREWSSWTSRCVRQADRLLLVGQAGTDPAPGPVEAELERGPASSVRELVLVQSEACRRPSGTGAWLTQRAVHAHHHVRLHVASDFASLARRMTGRAVGLVLGGGGARGYAHIGVIRALEEAGVHIDMLAGTSMGALLAGLYATGMDTNAIMAEAMKFGSRKRLFDYTVPFVSFLASRKVTAMLQTVFGDIAIEDLWRPFFCIRATCPRQDLWSTGRAPCGSPYEPAWPFLACFHRCIPTVICWLTAVS